MGFNRLKNIYIGRRLFQYNEDDILIQVLIVEGFFRITSSKVIKETFFNLQLLFVFMFLCNNTVKRLDYEKNQN